MPTTIEWTDHTWNPVTGCTNISPGCDNCYAETITNRFKRHPWNEVTLHPDRIKADPSWKPGHRIFLCSMGDLFHSAVPWEFIARVFDFMQALPEFTFQVLTKRPGRMLHFANVYLPNRAIGLGGDPMYKGAWPSNVWAGTSVEQEYDGSRRITARLDLLTQVSAPVRFVSYEPALGLVHFEAYLRWSDLDAMPLSLRGRMATYALSNGINWVIAGGESGSKARRATNARRRVCPSSSSSGASLPIQWV